MSVPADRTVRAVCHRCGGPKKGPLIPCKTCSFTPTGEERPIAWLFSAHHLTDAELDETTARILAGEQPDPSKALSDGARVAMGAAPLTDDARRPLRTGTLILIGLGNLLLTPLLGFAFWFGLIEERPRAARQALTITLPMSLALALVWLVVVASQRL